MTLPVEAVTPPGEATSTAEAGVLARHAAAAYRDLVESYKNAYGLAHAEAVARADEPDPPGRHLTMLEGPPDQVTWHDLERLGQRSPERMLERWEEIKQAAREELQTGDRAAAALEAFGSDCWRRAQFAAILSELAEGWQPRNGLERLLLDQMALAHSSMLDWMKTLAQYEAARWARERREQREGEGWDPPRVSEHQAVEQAAAMADRFNRMFLRTLRALRDLRRGPQPVFVQNAGQVNVGQQQVNVSGGEP
jgi:hypothetical protein